MYSHEELISAVSAAGREGKTFTVKDVRAQLGFDSRDKKELSRFRRRLRAFEKAAADQLEKLGDNSYRLRPGAFEGAASSPAPVHAAIAEPAAAPAPAPAPTTEQPNIAARVALDTDTDTNIEAPTKPGPEVQLEPASGVFQSALPANEPEAQQQPVREPPTLHVVERFEGAPASDHESDHESDQPDHASIHANDSARAAYVASPPPPHEHSVSTPQRVLGVAGALVSTAFAASAAVSGKVRERGRNLREQLWSCVRSAPARKHAFARLRGWAESVRPLSNEVREQLSALRQRVLASRRRAA